jgi:hypothetical protein
VKTCEGVEKVLVEGKHRERERERVKTCEGVVPTVKLTGAHLWPLSLRTGLKTEPLESRTRFHSTIVSSRLMVKITVAAAVSKA